MVRQSEDGVDNIDRNLVHNNTLIKPIIRRNNKETKVSHKFIIRTPEEAD